MQSINNIVVYYFSGTGNAKNVVRWLVNSAKEKEIDCQLVNIAERDINQKTTPPQDALVFFISPLFILYNIQIASL